MKYHELLNCFINSVSHAYFARYNRPLVDEDLSMAFDAADVYARAYPDGSIDQMHALGQEYFDLTNR